MKKIVESKIQKPTLIYNSPKVKFKHKFMIGIPTTGTIRYEFAAARYSAVIPVNWEMKETIVNMVSPVGYHVDEARNICVKNFLQSGCEWLFFIDHDVILPPDIWIKIDKYMKTKKYPIVSGLYYAKGSHPEPLIFRGAGCYYDWDFGDKVMVDAVVMGCTLIHHSILQWSWDNAEPYQLPDGTNVRRVFHTPREATLDEKTGQYFVGCGTEDLWFCKNVRENKVLEKTGWNKLAKKKNPFLTDTSIFCQHIDPDGVMYPNNVGMNQSTIGKIQKILRKDYCQK